MKIQIWGFSLKMWRCSATELAFPCGNNGLELSHNWSQLLSSSPKSPPPPKIDACLLCSFTSLTLWALSVWSLLWEESIEHWLSSWLHIGNIEWLKNTDAKAHPRNSVCLLGLNCNLGFFFKAPQVIPLSRARLRTTDRDLEGKKAQAQSMRGRRVAPRKGMRSGRGGIVDWHLTCS